MKVKELLSDESKWTKGTYARTKDGVRTTESAPDAVCWCLSGAIYLCYPPNTLGEWLRIIRLVEERIRTHIPNWNDSPERSFQDVKSLVEELDI